MKEVNTMSESGDFYTVRVGTRGNTPNRGEDPTFEDFIQASQFGVDPTEPGVTGALERLQSGYREPTAETSRTTVEILMQPDTEYQA